MPGHEALRDLTNCRLLDQIREGQLHVIPVLSDYLQEQRDPRWQQVAGVIGFQESIPRRVAARTIRRPRPPRRG
jgi:hypothetical protein